MPYQPPDLVTARSLICPLGLNRCFVFALTEAEQKGRERRGGGGGIEWRGGIQGQEGQEEGQDEEEGEEGEGACHLNPHAPALCTALLAACGAPSLRTSSGPFANLVHCFFS